MTAAIKPQTMRRSVRFSAAYMDGVELTRTAVVDVPVSSDEDVQREYLWPHTGFGRDPEMPAVYNADSIDGRWPTICLEWA